MTRKEYIYLWNSELILAALLILERVDVPDIVDSNTLQLVKGILYGWEGTLDSHIHIEFSEVDDDMISEIYTQEIKANCNLSHVDKMLFLLPDCDLEIVRNNDGTPMVTSGGNWVLSGTTKDAFPVVKQQGYVEFA